MKQTLVLAALMITTALQAGNEQKLETSTAGTGTSLSAAFVDSGKQPLLQGTVTHPMPVHTTPGAHVDITWMGSSRHAIGEKAVRLPRLSPKRESSGCLASVFRTSFTKQELHRTSKVKVVYKPYPHSRCSD